MGGDFAPQASVAGAVLALNEIHPDDIIVLIGDETVIHTQLKNHQTDTQRIEIVHAPDVIEMGEQPTKAFSLKPHSSISVGFRLLKSKKIDAFTSAGNTGAMLVGSIYAINPVPGIIRPCTTALLPRENGGFNLLLDVGTNPDARPDVMYQFGILGSVYSQFVMGVEKPRVALLNIGEEDEKGNLASQSAFRLMKDSPDFHFIGNVEARDLYKDKADVFVCDGFTGNVVLKLTEAWYRMIMKKGFNDEYFNRFNYENYGGTPILGINATVLVGHGISNNIAFKNMILLAGEIYRAKLPGRIKNALLSKTGQTNV